MTKLKMWNSGDLALVRAGHLKADAVRTVEIDALVDTGATGLLIPAEAAKTLGLPVIAKRPVKMADGRKRKLPKVGDLRISIHGRDMSCDALVGPAGTTALIGQIQLEELDLVVDPGSRECRPNPAHPDGPELELLSAA